MGGVMKKTDPRDLAKYFLNAPRCGAKSRRNNHQPCRAPAMANGRCRLHGGKSTGPKTLEGKIRSANAHLTHGLRTKEAMNEQRKMREMMKWREDLQNTEHA